MCRMHIWHINHSTLNKIKPPRPLASALVSFLSNYYVKFTISHLTSPLPPHLFSLEKVILMMSWSCLWSCWWSYLWCYLLTSVGDHIKKITCLNSWHVTLSFTWPEFLPPRDFIWFELSIKHLPNSLFGLFTLLLYLWVWKTYGNATH